MQKDFMTITPDSGGGVTGSDRGCFKPIQVMLVPLR